MARPYGAPLHCPKCSFKHYYGVLKLQNGPKNLRCPNCSTLLVRSPAKRHRNTATRERREPGEGIAVEIDDIGVGPAITIDDGDLHALAARSGRDGLATQEQQVTADGGV